MGHTYLGLVFVSVPGLLTAQNTCDSAVPIVPGTYQVAAVDGTEPPTPRCVTPTVVGEHGEWYTYTPAQDGSLLVSSDFSANVGIDTRLHVYTGTCGALQCVAGDDDSGLGNLARVLFNVEGGVTYRIAWDDGWSSSGFTFRVADSLALEYDIPFTTGTINPIGGLVRGVLDMNNDGLDDVVAIQSITNLGISTSATIHYQQATGGFQATMYDLDSLPNRPVWSFCAGDLDANGHNDMLFAGTANVSLVFSNATGTGFDRDTTFAQYVFCQRSNLVDIDNDGGLDAFVCHDVQPNVRMMNNGDGTFTFIQGGLGDTPNGGNYGSIWTDFDNDGDVDLYLSKCRGNNPASINQLHRNNGNGTFTDVAPQFNMDQIQQNWSSAFGDFDNDGDMDALVGVSADYTGWHELMRNDGSTFTDVTVGSGYDLFGGMSIQHITHDFDNDGWLDIMGGGGVIMRNNHDMTFTPNVVGFDVGAVGDLNNDRYLDMLRDNTVRYNAGAGNNWLRVMPVGTISNRNAIGARVTITTPSGQQIREIRSGDGFTFMNSLAAHFGLGQDQQVLSVTVRFPSGIINTVNDPPINGTITVVEESSTGILASPVKSLRLYPVPVSDKLWLAGQDAGWTEALIMDAQGRWVAGYPAGRDGMDVSHLAPGHYVLRAIVRGERVSLPFVKE